jgi:flagellar biosynthesis chaperone FliJ
VAKRDDSSALEAAIDELYQQPLASFTTARNALATELRKAGRASDAERVKALGKPSVSTWALNQVYWHDRDVFDRMLRAGDHLRRVQQQLLKGKSGDLRESTAARQDAVRALVERAVETLRASGNPVTDATRNRLMVTADAMATYGSDSQAFRPGRLVDDLDPPGFAALATLGAPGASSLRLVKGEQSAAAPAPGPAPAKPSTAGKAAADRTAAREREAERKRRRAEAQDVLRDAERALRDADRELARLQQQADKARTALQSIIEVQQDLEQRLAQLEPKARAAREASAAADRTVTAAEQTVQQARNETDRARAELDALEER